MDSNEHVTPSCETLSTTSPEAVMNLQISTQTFKIEIKEEIPTEYIDEESSCSDYMYSSEPLESTKYVNYYDSKIGVLEELKKEFPEDECPQPESSMNGKVVSENTGLLPLIKKQKTIIENTEEEFTFNLKDANGNRNKQITIKTERLEDQDIRNNSGATSVHYDVLVTPQEVKCKLCDKIFKNNFSLLKHNNDHIKIEVNTQADNEINELDKRQSCDKRFDNYNNMLTHVTDVHSENNPKCEMRFNSVPKLERHVTLLHELNNLPNQVTLNVTKCIYCNVDFKHKYRLNSHMKLCRAGKEDKGIIYKCDLCKRVYKSKQSLVAHIKKSHYDYGRMFECWCGKQFPSPIHLSEHKSFRHCIKRKNELYKCNYCEALYNAKTSLTEHVKRMHYDYGKMFECWCGKKFRTPKYLREHMRRQHGSKMKNRNNDIIQCEPCQKTFKTKHYLLTHIKNVHYDYGKVFECWCGKQFRTPILLSNHKKRHPDSNINDTSNDKLNNHMNLCLPSKESKELKYKCESCGGVYKNKETLTKHIKRVHYDYGRTFACWCGKQFRTPFNLRQHKRRHTDGNINDTNNVKFYILYNHMKPQ